jgi:hypothetical protein
VYLRVLGVAWRAVSDGICFGELHRHPRLILPLLAGVYKDDHDEQEKQRFRLPDDGSPHGALPDATERWEAISDIGLPPAIAARELVVDLC